MAYQTGAQLDTVISSINKHVNKVLTDKLTPIIQNAQNNHNQNHIITNLLKQLPEFQQLLIENKQLKETISELTHHNHLSL